MTNAFLLFFIMAVAYLLMRRRGRAFLEREEGILLGGTLVLCLVQKVLTQNVSLSDVFITPVYIALVITAGHARGPAQGAVCGFFSAMVIAFCAFALASFEAGASSSMHFPPQYLFFIGVWMVLGGAAGMNQIPKPFKPFLAVLWLLLVAAYSPRFLTNLSAYIILFGAICLASIGLYFNLFKRRSVSTVYYPTSPSRRAE